jgi:hypothetical protein
MMSASSRDAAAPDAALRIYVDAAATALALPIPAEYRAGVERQFARIAAFALVVAQHGFAIDEESAPLSHTRES